MYGFVPTYRHTCSVSIHLYFSFCISDIFILGQKKHMMTFAVFSLVSKYSEKRNYAVRPLVSM
jgi:hypothetical protein